MTRLLPLLVLAFILVGCSNAPTPTAVSTPQAAVPAPVQAVATQQAPATTTPTTWQQSFLVSETAADAPAAFDRIEWARGICAYLRKGYTVRQLHEVLMRQGLDRRGATNFESMAVVMICPDQQPKLPDGPNDWWRTD